MVESNEREGRRSGVETTSLLRRGKGEHRAAQGRHRRSRLYRGRLRQRLLPRSNRERFLPVLLVGALLLCHGVFGVTHLVCDSPKCAGGTHDDVAEHQHAAGAQGDIHAPPANHAMGTEYFAVVVIGFLGLLSRLLYAVRPLLAKDSTSWFFPSWRVPVVSRPPPTPAPHLLQVFRL
jgi:hypothetical protein